MAIENSNNPQEHMTPEEMESVKKEMHMTGRAIRVDQTLKEYNAEGERTWAEKQSRDIEGSTLMSSVNQIEAETNKVGLEQKKMLQSSMDESNANLAREKLGIAKKSGSENNLDISAAGKQLSTMIDGELISFFLSRDITELKSLGFLALEEEDRALLKEIKVTLQKEMATMQKGGEVSIRKFIFHRMSPEIFDKYETLNLAVKSRILHGGIWKSLSEKQKSDFPVKQQEAVEIFLRMQKGEEFDDISLTDSERDLIFNIKSLSKKTGIDLIKNDKLIYENFIQKTAYQLIKKGEQVENIPKELISPNTESIPVEQLSKTEGNKSWQEVVRISDQEAIGDLNGSYESFVDHLKERGLIDENNGKIEWRGGNKRVVFVGDILGDRTANGMKVMEALSNLNKEAVKQGGSVESLSGNHDNMFTSVLGGFNTEGVSAENDNRIYGYSGTLESAFYADPVFKDYIISRFKESYESKKLEFEIRIAKKEKILAFLQKDPNHNLETLSTFSKSIDEMKDSLQELADIYTNIKSDDEERFFSMLKYLEYKDAVVIGKSLCQNRDVILNNMKNSQSGKERLEAICSQKMSVLHDDTLYTHTNLTYEMTQEILKGSTIEAGISEINNLYTKGLRHYLLGEGEFTAEESKKFDEIRLMFLSTSKESRINFSEDSRLSEQQKKAIEDALRKKGVNLVIHGHNDESGTVKGGAGIPIVSIDRSVYKFDESWGQNKPKATLTIDKKGNVISDEAKQVVRTR